ncbi:hypothetical protein C0J52_14031 [Blattella germanica]|nr:hypothetical protein C0J52_14031 [Blattella germanica]
MLIIKLTKFTETQIPECQYGFQQGRRMLQAVENLLVHIENSTRRQSAARRPHHPIVIQYRYCRLSKNKKGLTTNKHDHVR